MMKDIFLKDILDFGKNIFSNGALLSIIYIIFIFIIAKIIVFYLNMMLSHFAKRQNRDNDMIFVMFKNILKFIIYVIVLVISLYEIVPLRGISTAILGLSGIVTVALTLGTQEIASNLISGIMLSTYQPFKKGDLIVLVEKDIIGIIEDLNFRHAIIRTFENSKIIVPNKILNEAIVENRGSTTSDPYYNTFFYNIAYGSDYKLAIKLIELFLKESNIVLKKNETVVSLNSLADSSLLIKVKCYTQTPGLGLELKAKLNEYILDSFKENNIEIPYPHLSVELNTNQKR